MNRSALSGFPCPALIVRFLIVRFPWLPFSPSAFHGRLPLSGSPRSVCHCPSLPCPVCPCPLSLSCFPSPNCPRPAFPCSLFHRLPDESDDDDGDDDGDDGHAVWCSLPGPLLRRCLSGLSLPGVSSSISLVRCPCSVVLVQISLIRYLFVRLPSSGVGCPDYHYPVYHCLFPLSMFNVRCPRSVFPLFPILLARRSYVRFHRQYVARYPGCPVRFYPLECPPNAPPDCSAPIARGCQRCTAPNDPCHPHGVSSK